MVHYRFTQWYIPPCGPLDLCIKSLWNLFKFRLIYLPMVLKRSSANSSWYFVTMAPWVSISYPWYFNWILNFIFGEVIFAFLMFLLHEIFFPIKNIHIMIHFNFKIKFLNFINVFAFIHDFPIKVSSRYPIYL